MAVYVFFAISGFLIASSFENSRSVWDWAAARVLRLFPGLFVTLTLTVFILGPLVTTVPLGRYFTDPATLVYIPQNLALVTPKYDLPGVFADNPYPSAINGSLWTLFYEVVCYLGVLVLGLCGALSNRKRMSVAVLLYFCFYMGTSWLGLVDNYKARVFADLSLPFIVGASLFTWRDFVPMAPVFCLFLFLIVALTTNTALYHISFVLALAYSVFLFAYLPRGFIRKFNYFGDYSYGTYVYAFPLQQLTVYWFGPQDPLQNVVLSGALTIVFAVLSWHLIERPALASRSQLRLALARGATVRDEIED